MPEQTRFYSDMDYRLRITPSGNVVVHRNQDAINQSIRMIFATVSGERVRSNIGSSVIQLLFEPVSNETSRDLKDLLKQNVERYEPRVQITNLKVIPNFDSNEYDVRLRYHITQSPQTMTFSTRLRSLGE